MIIGDLEAELVVAVRTIAPDLADEALARNGSTWHRAPDGDPAGYSTSLAFDLAVPAGRSAADLAQALAEALARVEWVSAAEPTGGGYLTIAVTAQKLADVASRIVASGPACARSTLLRGTAATIEPWPDLAAAPSWQYAWDEQAKAMTGGLAEAAGASASATRPPPQAAIAAQSAVRAATQYFGPDEIRYLVARTLPGRVRTLTRPSEPEPNYAAVQLAHAEAASTLRWAADLSLDRDDPVAAHLDSGHERELLSLLSWFPIKVASAASRHRPAELPRYLEEVAAVWTRCRLARPALPFHGAAAPRDPARTAARLLLADAVRIVLAAGLELTGIAPHDRI